MARLSLSTLVVFSLTAGAVIAGEQLCNYVDPRYENKLTPNKAVCVGLEDAVRSPDPDNLGAYEETLNQYFQNWCHRDADAGWVSDKYVRQLGPYVETFDVAAGQWEGPIAKGFHNPSVIWYSPKAFEWIKTYRSSEEGYDSSQVEAMPDGAIMVKEMYSPPGTYCQGMDVKTLFPSSGLAIMIRASQYSHDGWFWGYYGYPAGENEFVPDWPATGNSIPNMGFGQYCVNCHASAIDNSTFASAKNIAGMPGEPNTYLTNEYGIKQYLGPVAKVEEEARKLYDHHAAVMGREEVLKMVSEVLAQASSEGKAGAEDAMSQNNPILEYLYGDASKPIDPHAITMPSQTYDNVWPPQGEPDAHSKYLTSDQCLGCHDAGGTGMQFDMTVLDPEGSGKLLNYSPYATWRTSPMGLAGRDPIFFSQLASEVQTFHTAEGQKALVENACLGCHGISGQRQYQIDTYDSSNNVCQDFSRDDVNAIPYQADAHDQEYAKYGALARDGINCIACHGMDLDFGVNPSDTVELVNECVVQRQDYFNPHNEGFAKTFTGSFEVDKAGELAGPFKDPKEKPMEHALNITPVHNDAMKDSAVCGSCHTVHLPIFASNGDQLGSTYEQTTYPEWAFSDFRSGYLGKVSLPHGAGSTPEECQGCHMVSKDSDGKPFMSKIAGIQEKTNFPRADFTLPEEEIDLPYREGFAKHSLVGLNLFLVEMAKQGPDILGIPETSPMLVSKGLDPIELTKREMLDNAQNYTADVSIDSGSITATPQDDGYLFSVPVKVTNKIGHKFPSGVGFRRAFLHFEALDASGAVLWQSGNTNEAGIIIGSNGDPIEGELWWDKSCNQVSNFSERPHQPHYQVVDSQDTAQIYQELTVTPASAQSQCGAGAEPDGVLTTSFLSICSKLKDNRLLPKGFLPLDQRKDIAEALGAGEDLAAESGAEHTGTDPDYDDNAVASGSDALVYKVSLPKSGLEGGSVTFRARLYYQATPPYYLQDRFCTAQGPDKDRLLYLSSKIGRADTTPEIQSWKLKVGNTASYDFNLSAAHTGSKY